MRDLDAAKHFYGDILGMHISSDESPRAVFFRFGDYHHDVGVFKVSDDAELPRADQPGLMHAAFLVDSLETLVEMYHRLQDHGVTVEVTMDHGVTRSLYVYDPDRNPIELYCDVPEWDWHAKFSISESLDLDTILAH